MTQQHSEIEISRFPIPEEWNGSFFRKQVWVTYVMIDAPDDLLNSAWNDILSCIETGKNAAKATPLTAGITFLASFLPSVASKLAARAQEVKAPIVGRAEPDGDWHKHPFFIHTD